MKRIVILNNSEKNFDYEINEFEKAGAKCFVKSWESEESLIKAAFDAHIIVLSNAVITSNVINNIKNCQLIVRSGIGYDNIDIKKAAKKGIMVCNSPNYGILDVAEHALSLLMSCSKRLVFMDELIRNGIWDVSKTGRSHRLHGKTIGFLGFGRIGKCLCERTNALGMGAIVCDPFVEEKEINDYNAKRVEFDELLKQSDYITLHLPLNEETRHILGKNEFKKMKNSAVIINTSRGSLINEPELIDALETGEISGAGLDVFENEYTDLDKRLLNMKNVVLTPHVAWNTYEGAEALKQEVVDNVLRFLNGKKPVSIVNEKYL